MKFQAALLTSSLALSASFQPIFPTKTTAPRSLPRSSAIFASAAAPPAEIETLRLKEIKAELKEQGISYTDCFDRESLVNRLKDTRDGKVKATPPPPKIKTEKVTKPSKKPKELDEKEILADLRSQGLKDLKLQCSRRGLRYATFLEKEEFVQTIWKDMQEVGNFSASGVLRPGQVTEVTGAQLDEEMALHDTPILVDVYATWCGPCKMMAPEMDKLAEELGIQCRVAKLDSDQHPAWAGRYKIQGLPTTLIIQNGEVADRLEGAIMKDQLLQFVQPYLN